MTYRFRVVAIYSNDDNRHGPSSKRVTLGSAADHWTKVLVPGPIIVEARPLSSSEIFIGWQVSTTCYCCCYYYLREGGHIIASVSTYVCFFLSVGRRTGFCKKNFQAIFVKPCRITDYYYAKNPLHFGVDLTHNAQVAALLDFRYLRVYIVYYLFSSTFSPYCNVETPPSE